MAEHQNNHRHGRRLDDDEYRLVGQILAISVSPPWPQLVLRVMNATGPGQGAKAAAILWRLLPGSELERLESVLARIIAASMTAPP